jgi:integral membrane protein
VTESHTESKPSRVAIGSLSSALRTYRALAFVTGVVLAAGTGGLIWEAVDTYNREIGWLGPLWIAHGYLFMAYVLVSLNLAVHLRWHPVRAVLVMAAGTIPTASFVAERMVARQVRSLRP